jgi:hypothetical protein
MRHPLHHGIPEPIPFDRGITARVALVEQLAVLDEQQSTTSGGTVPNSA